MNKQISRVAMVALLLLASLIVATTYWQSWEAPTLAAKQDNAIQRVAQFHIKRGFIYAAGGKLLLAENLRKTRPERHALLPPLSDERPRLAGRRVLDPGPVARGDRTPGERLPDRLERQSRHALRQALRQAEGHHGDREQPRAEHSAGRAADRRDGAAGEMRRGGRAQSEDGPGVRDGVVAGLQPEQDRVVGRLREHPPLAQCVPGLGVAAVQPRDGGALCTWFDVQDDHGRGGARIREVHAGLELLRPRLLHRVRRADPQRARPERPRAVRQRRPDRGVHPLDQRRLLRPRHQARRKDDPRQGETVRLLLDTADRTAVERGRGERPLQLQEAQALRQPLDRRPGPPGVRPGEHARARRCRWPSSPPQWRTTAPSWRRTS